VEGFLGKNMKQMKTHWVADMYPLNESDIAALAEDIKANGQIAPIKMLKDGCIIDGRNRWMACQKAGVEPLIDVINPDGEEVTDERLFALATSCNSMRRDLTTSERAVASAVAWKRLFPEGQQNTGRSESKNGLSFETFANQSFKVGKSYAKQALAIANYSPELLEAAKESLDGAYKTYQSEKLKREDDKRNRQLLVDHPDLKERVANGNLSAEEAITIARKRDAEIIAKEESLKQQKAFIAQGFNRTIELFHGLLNWDSSDILEAIENEALANAASQPKHEGESLLLAIKTMTEIHNRKYSK
jgi:hypothetical protein